MIWNIEKFVCIAYNCKLWFFPYTLSVFQVFLMHIIKLCRLVCWQFSFYSADFVGLMAYVAFSPRLSLLHFAMVAANAAPSCISCTSEWHLQEYMNIVETLPTSKSFQILLVRKLAQMLWFLYSRYWCNYVEVFPQYLVAGSD